MSDGTPIDALDTGEISSAADEQKMAAILSEMNSMGADVAAQQAQQQQPPQYNPMAQMPPMQPMQPMPPMPPMMMQQPPMYQQQQYQQHYVPVDEEPEQVKGKKKRNVWSSIMDRILDPIIVAFIVFVVSLPVLHTFIGKYASWAFAVGGQLSWFGLIALSVIAGLIFGGYRAASELF
jgi:hypothetical protein